MHHQATTQRWSSLLDPPASTGGLPPATAAVLAAITAAGGQGEGEDEYSAGWRVDLDEMIESNEHDELPLELRSDERMGRVLRLTDQQAFASGTSLAPRAVLVLGERSIGCA